MADFYTGYGLLFDSEVALPAPPADPDGGDPDIRIRLGSVDTADLDRSTASDRASPAPGTAYYWYDDVGTVGVFDGQEIVVDRIPESVDREVRFAVTGGPLGMALHQRGVFTLHGSCVEIDGSAVAFLGHRDSGKSTTAAAFVDRGYRVLADDIVAVPDPVESETAVSGFPALKLDRQSASILRSRTDFSRNTDEKYIRSGSEVSTPVPLDYAYVLGDGAEIATESLSPRDQFVELIGHTFVGKITGGHTPANFFRACTGLADSVTVKRLSRPLRLDALVAVVDTVEADINSR